MTIKEVQKMDDLKPFAHELAKVNHYIDEGVTKTYWFNDPQGQEIRLIHVKSDTVFRPQKVRPFYFGSSVTDGNYNPPSAIALVHPEDEKNLPLPDGWGEWNAPTQVWEWNGADGE